MKRHILFIGILIFLLSACEPSGDIEVHNAWVRPTAQGENAAIYFAIHNHSQTSDELIGASTTITNTVEIHESSQVNDVIQMNMLTSIPLEADEEITFKPGGLHVMLIGIDQELEAGEHIGLILHFQKHEDILVNVHIEESAPDEDEHIH
jgi:copper(I)-binding protein